MPSETESDGRTVGPDPDRSWALEPVPQGDGQVARPPPARRARCGYRNMQIDNSVPQ
jgi:hypothetical protein